MLINSIYKFHGGMFLCLSLFYFSGACRGTSINVRSFVYSNTNDLGDARNRNKNLDGRVWLPCIVDIRTPAENDQAALMKSNETNSRRTISGYRLVPLASRRAVSHVAACAITLHTPTCATNELASPD